MAYQIVRKPNMNRCYVTGDTAPIRGLLFDLSARRDDFGAWVPLHQEAALRAALKTGEEYSALVQSLRESFSADTYIGFSSPDNVTMTDLWHEWRQAGSENWCLGSDGAVYRMISDYDMGPRWWRTSATPEQVERAKALGMKVI